MTSDTDKVYVVALISLIVAIVGAGAAVLVVPEFRILIGLQPEPDPEQATNPPAEESANLPREDAELATPAGALRAYAGSLTTGDFARIAKKIYPRESQATLKGWVEGEDGSAPLTRVEVVGKPEVDEASPDEVTLLATMQYCSDEQDGRPSRDSRDTKYYTFIKTQGVWQLNSMTAPEDREDISC